MQAMDEEPQLLARCRDRFMIQTIAVAPAKESLSHSDLVRNKLSAPLRPSC